MKDVRRFLGGLALAFAASGLAVAQETPPPEPTPPPGEPATVDQRLEDLDQKIRILQRQREIEAEAAEERKKTASQFTAGREGFSWKSADGDFLLRLRGYLQLDGRFFSGGTPTGTDTFLLRRVRPIFEATVFKIFDVRVMPDFGQGTTVLFDGYVEARFSPALRLRAGKFKPPIGLERLQSATDILFNERAQPTNLVPNRDVGVQLSGDLANARVQYAVGVFNGVPDLGNGDLDNNDGKDVAARLFFQPFVADKNALSGLGFGIAASTGDQAGTVTAPNLPAFRTPGQVSFFSYRSDGNAAGTTVADGTRKRLSPQATFYLGPFGLLTEYVSSKQEVRRASDRAELTNTAWQAAASWVIGGTASFRGVTPKKPFDGFGSGPGAFELAVRYSRLEVDRDAFPLFANPASAARTADAWALGVNWWANRNVRLMTSYEMTTFDGGAAAGADRPDERVLFTRFQIAF
jgi:phosphate-selective porin OprO and OprP